MSPDVSFLAIGTAHNVDRSCDVVGDSGCAIFDKTDDSGCAAPSIHTYLAGKKVVLYRIVTFRPAYDTAGLVIGTEDVGYGIAVGDDIVCSFADITCDTADVVEAGDIAGCHHTVYLTAVAQTAYCDTDMVFTAYVSLLDTDIADGGA